MQSRQAARLEMVAGAEPDICALDFLPRLSSASASRFLSRATWNDTLFQWKSQVLRQEGPLVGHFFNDLGRRLARSMTSSRFNPD